MFTTINSLNKTFIRSVLCAVLIFGFTLVAPHESFAQNINLFGKNELSFTAPTKGQQITAQTFEVAGTCNSNSSVIVHASRITPRLVPCVDGEFSTVLMFPDAVKSGSKNVIARQLGIGITSVRINYVQSGTAQQAFKNRILQAQTKKVTNPINYDSDVAPTVPTTTTSGRRSCEEDPQDVLINGVFTADNYFHAVQTDDTYNSITSIVNDIHNYNKGGFQLAETATFILKADERVVVFQWEDGASLEGFLAQLNGNGKSAYTNAENWEYIITSVPKPVYPNDVTLGQMKTILKNATGWKSAVELVPNDATPLKNGQKWPIIPGIDMTAMWMYSAPHDLDPDDPNIVPSVITLFRTVEKGSNIVDCEDPENPLPTVDLQASKYVVDAGQSTELFWTSTNATKCDGNGSGGYTYFNTGGATQMNYPPGVPSVVTKKQFYNIVCYNQHGTATDTVTVDITSYFPPPLVTLEAVRTAKIYDLIWKAQNALFCKATDGYPDFQVIHTNGKFEFGVDDVYPYQTTKYTIECVDKTGQKATASVTLDPIPK